MPNIREFNNPVSGLTPDRGPEQVAAMNARHTEAAFAQAGSQIGGGIAAAGDAYTRIKTQQEISQGLATSAELQSNVTTAWDVTLKNSDPNDHSVAEKFREEQLNPILDAWTSSFKTEQGKAWAEEHAGALRQHFFEKTAADQSLMAGEAAVQNFHQFTTGMSTTVLQDPSSLNMALGTADRAIDALLSADPNLTPSQTAAMRGELRDKAREEIAKSAFIGTARSNPDAAMADLQSGKYNQLLDGTTQNQLFGFAESIKREQRADQRAQEVESRQQQKDDFNAKRASLEASMFQPDGSVRVPPGFHQQLVMLSQHPGAAQEPGAISALGDAAARATTDAINGTFTRTDNATWSDLAGRIGAAPSDPNALTHTQVNRAYADGKLSKSDWQFLSKAVDGSNDPAQHQALSQLNQALERVKPLVGKANMFGQLDQSGIANFAALHYDTVQRFNQMVASGMSPAEAEKVLEDPRDPRGIQAHLAAYQTSNKQGLANVHARVSGTGGPYSGAAPRNAFDNGRKPGESAADYLKRTGG